MGIEDDIARADEPSYVRELEALGRVEQLQRDLDNSRAAVEAVQGHLLAEMSTLRGQNSDQSAMILELSRQHGAGLQAIRRLCAEQVQLVRALRALVNAAKMLPTDRSSVEPYRALAKRVTEAEEVLALVEIPFG